MVNIIKKKTLIGHLKKISMTSEQQLTDMLLRFEEGGLKLSANDSAKQVRVMSHLLSTAFKSYEAIGNVGFNDVETLIKVLDRFDDEITLKKEGNLMTISGKGKKVDIELVAENFLETDTGEPKLEFTDTFVTTADKLKDIFKDVKMNKDATMTLETTEKKVTITNTGKYKFVNEINAPTCKGGAKTTFGNPFMNATEALDGILDISMSTNYPIKVREKTEDSVITFIIAPRVEDS